MKLGSVVGPVIQANGRLTFEDDLRSGGLLYFTTQWISIRTELADSMVTLGWLGVERLQFCQQDTSCSGKCHRRAAVGHLFWNKSVIHIGPVSMISDTRSRAAPDQMTVPLNELPCTELLHSVLLCSNVVVPCEISQENEQTSAGYKYIPPHFVHQGCLIDF